MNFALVWESLPQHDPRPVRVLIFGRPTAKRQQTFPAEGRPTEHGLGQPEASDARAQHVQELPKMAQATPPQVAPTEGEHAARVQALQALAQQGNLQALQ
jgi:hypothetical protein